MDTYEVGITIIIVTLQFIHVFLKSVRISNIVIKMVKYKRIDTYNGVKMVIM